MFGSRGRLSGPLLLLLAAFGIFVGLAAVGAMAAPTHHATALANSVTYQDSTGENPAALDIGTVVVSNDDQ